MTYIEMVEILLGLLRADREGDWNLHLSCIRGMIPWCFAMDKTNYARYLPVYYAQMTNLKSTSPDLYEHFQGGGFSVQLSDSNPFGRIAVDQTTEETVNKDTQPSGGTRGFSLKPGTLTRYYLTAEYRASALRQLRDHVSSKSQRFSHADLGASRIRKDESDVSSLADMLENNWINPFVSDPSDIVSLSTGLVAPSEVANDLQTAHQRGENAFREFQVQRREKGDGFYEPIKMLQIRTFSAVRKRPIRGTNKEVILRADRRVFGNMILIAQNRRLEMKDVLCYLLGPLPWALANVDGTLKKTNKATLAKHLENKVSPTEECPGQSATLIDAMGLIQKMHGENQTFEELSNHVLKQMIHAGQSSDIIDVVFDVYQENSIKSTERANRGSNEGISFSQIRPGHKIKNWRRLLASTSSKNQLTTCLAKSWKNSETRRHLGSKTLFITCGGECFTLCKESVNKVDSLASNHEEADTRLSLHAKHAAVSYPSLICLSDDTAAFIIYLPGSEQTLHQVWYQGSCETR